MDKNINDYYSSTYEEARNKFLDTCAQNSFRVDSLPLEGHDDLFIDIARSGNRESKKALIITSGVHGVEGFIGSALQSLCIDTLDNNQDYEIIYIHLINPYGVKYLRRWNEFSVDLNRNFYDGPAPVLDNDLYRNIDSVLNAKRRSGLKRFGLKSFWLILKYGFSKLQQAIAQGQYKFPKGIFYGGTEMQRGPKMLSQYLRKETSDYEKVYGIDIHTGLGKRYDESLFLEGRFPEKTHNFLESEFGRQILYVKPGGKKTYKIFGGFIAYLNQIYKTEQFYFLTMEFGTVKPVQIIKALRKENYFFQHEKHTEEHYKAAEELRESFSPTEPEWVKISLEKGLKSIKSLYKIAADN